MLYFYYLKQLMDSNTQGSSDEKNKMVLCVENDFTPTWLWGKIKKFFGLLPPEPIVNHIYEVTSEDKDCYYIESLNNYGFDKDCFIVISER